jgi:hypothetical protein
MSLEQDVSILMEAEIFKPATGTELKSRKVIGAENLLKSLGAKPDEDLVKLAIGSEDLGDLMWKLEDKGIVASFENTEEDETFDTSWIEDNIKEGNDEFYYRTAPDNSYGENRIETHIVALKDGKGKDFVERLGFKPFVWDEKTKKEFGDRELQARLKRGAEMVYTVQRGRRCSICGYSIPKGEQYLHVHTGGYGNANVCSVCVQSAENKMAGVK